MTKIFLLPVLGIAVLAGCELDPRRYETPPVTVDTARGAVVCQLYTHEQVIWDRAVAFPTGMSVQEADAICLAEGKRQQRS